MKAKAASLPDGLIENTNLQYYIYQAVACCRPERSAETAPAGSSYSQPMEIFFPLEWYQSKLGSHEAGGLLNSAGNVHTEQRPKKKKSRKHSLLLTVNEP